VEGDDAAGIEQEFQPAQHVADETPAFENFGLEFEDEARQPGTRAERRRLRFNVVTSPDLDAQVQLLQILYQKRRERLCRERDAAGTAPNAEKAGVPEPVG
jgi:hypothetical protein